VNIPKRGDISLGDCVASKVLDKWDSKSPSPFVFGSELWPFRAGETSSQTHLPTASASSYLYANFQYNQQIVWRFIKDERETV
jgi:hypothetical protein